MTRNPLVDVDDLAARAAATLKFGRTHASAFPEWTLPERIAAFPEALRRLPPDLADALRATHSGYYWSMNPLVLAVGWTRGGENVAYPPPEEQLMLACPGEPDEEYDHIARMIEVSRHVVRGLRDTGTAKELGGLPDDELDLFATSSVMFANVTPVCLSSKDGKYRADWRPFKPMFETILQAAKPLLVISVGNDAMDFFLRKAYPAVQQAPEETFTPTPPAREEKTRRCGIVDFGFPTAFVHLPYHPSYTGRYLPFQAQVHEVCLDLVAEVLRRRRR